MVRRPRRRLGIRQEGLSGCAASASCSRRRRGADRRQRPRRREVLRRRRHRGRRRAPCRPRQGGGRKGSFPEKRLCERFLPLARAGLLQKPYIVPGDLVVLGASQGGYVCADYDGGKGDLGGWLPEAAIEPAPVLDRSGGLGRRLEARRSRRSRFRKARGGLNAEGDATFGALDPAASSAAASMSANFPARSSFANGSASVVDKDSTRKDSFGCRLWLARVGRHSFRARQYAMWRFQRVLFRALPARGEIARRRSRFLYFA